VEQRFLPLKFLLFDFVGREQAACNGSRMSAKFGDNIVVSVADGYVIYAVAPSAGPFNSVRRQCLAMWNRLLKSHRALMSDSALIVSLQANAKVESASGKINPPWQIPWPFVMSARTAMMASPGAIRSSFIPSALLA
jgi:hypothetical protein